MIVTEHYLGRRQVSKEEFALREEREHERAMALYTHFVERATKRGVPFSYEDITEYVVSRSRPKWYTLDIHVWMKFYYEYFSSQLDDQEWLEGTEFGWVPTGKKINW